MCRNTTRHHEPVVNKTGAVCPWLILLWVIKEKVIGRRVVEALWGSNRNNWRREPVLREAGRLAFLGGGGCWGPALRRGRAPGAPWGDWSPLGRQGMGAPGWERRSGSRGQAEATPREGCSHFLGPWTAGAGRQQSFPQGPREHGNRSLCQARAAPSIVHRVLPATCWGGPYCSPSYKSGTWRPERRSKTTRFLSVGRIRALTWPRFVWFQGSSSYTEYLRGWQTTTQEPNLALDLFYK